MLRTLSLVLKSPVCAEDNGPKLQIVPVGSVFTRLYFRNFWITIWFYAVH
jgi:hypothetical protein